MDFEYSEGEQRFREEVIAFLDTHLTPDLRAGARATPVVFAEPDIGLVWQRILHEKGWLGYNWPVEHGGTGWTPVQRYIFEKELALADAPNLPVLSLKLLAPVLWTFGTEAQKSSLLPRILSGEDYWCQGFSEPSSGSDLASLKTRAVRDGDHYIVNGSKLWTTHAQFADHIFCLVRTDAEVKPQRGMSFLLIDMRQQGVEVKPIIGMAGDHEVNAVFFDDVKVPVADRVGDEGQGWTIAKFLLENERGGSCHAPRLLAELGALRRIAAEERDGAGGALLDDPLFAARLARTELEALALEMTELRILAEIAEGKAPGPQTSLVKMCASTLHQQIDSLTMSAFGYAGLQLSTARPLYAPGGEAPIRSKEAQVAPARALNGRAWTIFGGSNEVQRTIIAKTVLGL
ncbi:acyl-CoA dehydrogenase family protein [Rhizorhabdus dicambivorans]|uniref:Acyl-CoA dehydrogenase n=1 Tax=Rhizorhabdus dicambivorans TaxID=1850238 RepID=A0A2A4FVN9_9SPHN|nr:acyl-CoA dehydrogenase family protein [Rhizorhabdus dicambivorans]ATE66229.1 acyl-CoA dehydrogenase [Rhizorhabdus dicambivorans]PCE41742.1 acyl-CoA dehydrogenase [Rhizorhabdus dicambivorans]